MNENSEDDTGYLFPQIPEDAAREPFSFTEWEGFAVTQDELRAVQEILVNQRLTTQYAQLYTKGKTVRSPEGEVVLSQLESSDIIGIRYDGPIVILYALGRNQYPPEPKAVVDGFRKKASGKGIFFTALSNFEVSQDGKVTSISAISKQEQEKRVTKTTGFYVDSALMEAANALLLPQVKSNELELSLLSHTLRHGENLRPYEKSFKVEGSQLSEYLSRVRKERGSILWGVSTPITKNTDYLFGHGDFPGLNEIDIRNNNGVLPVSDFTFLAVKPNTFEDKLGQICQSQIITPQ